MICKEIEHGRPCPWEDYVDSNSRCKDCPSYVEDKRKEGDKRNGYEEDQSGS